MRCPRFVATVLGLIAVTATSPAAEDEHRWIHDLGHPELRVRRATERRLKKESPRWSVVSKALESADAHTAGRLLAYVRRELRYAPHDRKTRWLSDLSNDLESLPLFSREVGALAKHGGSPATAVARVAHMRLHKTRKYVAQMAARPDQHDALRRFDPKQGARWIELYRIARSDVAALREALDAPGSPVPALLTTVRSDTRLSTSAFRLIVAGTYNDAEAEALLQAIRKSSQDRVTGGRWLEILATRTWPESLRRAVRRHGNAARLEAIGLERVFWSAALVRCGEREHLAQDAARTDLAGRFSRLALGREDPPTANDPSAQTDLVTLATVAGLEIDAAIAASVAVSDATQQIGLIHRVSRFGPKTRAVVMRLAADAKEPASARALIRLVSDDRRAEKSDVGALLLAALSSDSTKRREVALEACRALERFSKPVVESLVVLSNEPREGSLDLEFARTIERILEIAPHACLPLLANVYLAKGENRSRMLFDDSLRRQALNCILELDVHDSISRRVMQRALIDGYDSHRYWALHAYRRYVAQPEAGDVTEVRKLLAHSDPLTRHHATRLMATWGR